ncbi:MAG: ABC transporter ATP-binding protein [Desulfurococcaceae archaeon]
MAEVVKLMDVWKVYYVGKVEFPALRGVDLSINKGEMIAIMGPSGSGKTTLLNMMGLLDRPTRGKIYIEGIDVMKLSSDKVAEIRNRKIGFVFQHFNLINRLSVYENIELPLVARGLPRKIREKMVINALEMVGGEISWLRKKPNQLSGGQQQRVAIARAIVGEPEILLADEPTGNLDRKSARIVVETFTKLNEGGLTIAIVTHDPEIANCTNTIYVIRDGKIVNTAIPDIDKCILKTSV